MAVRKWYDVSLMVRLDAERIETTSRDQWGEILLRKGLLDETDLRDMNFEPDYKMVAKLIAQHWLTTGEFALYVQDDDSNVEIDQMDDGNG